MCRCVLPGPSTSVVPLRGHHRAGRGGWGFFQRPRAGGAARGSVAGQAGGAGLGAPQGERTRWVASMGL